MIMNGQTSPQRAQRFFKKWTRLSIQVKGGATITISANQGEASAVAQGDGLQLTQASTAPPYDFWWKGELWYVASVNNTPFVLLMIGDADSLSGEGPQ
jgi:hypothetical protein